MPPKKTKHFLSAAVSFCILGVAHRLRTRGVMTTKDSGLFPSNSRLLPVHTFMVIVPKNLLMGDFMKTRITTLTVS